MSLKTFSKCTARTPTYSDNHRRMRPTSNGYSNRRGVETEKDRIVSTSCGVIAFPSIVKAHPREAGPGDPVATHQVNEAVAFESLNACTTATALTRERWCG